MTVFLCGMITLFLAAGCGDEEPNNPVENWRRVEEAAIPDKLREPRPGTDPVTIEPAGTWHVKKPPERFVTLSATEADIALALGRIDGLAATYDVQGLRRLQELFYRQLPGVELPADIKKLPDTISQELLLELAPDCYLIDPRRMKASEGWAVDQITTVARYTGPFVGNQIRTVRPPYYGPKYVRYSLDEYHRRLAKLFQREERYRRFADFRDAVLARIRERLPPAEQRPEICLLNAASNSKTGKFWIVDLAGRDRHPEAAPDNGGTSHMKGGNWVQQYHELGLRQAFDYRSYPLKGYGRTDYETLAAIDPPVIIVQWGITRYDGPEDFRKNFVEPMREHPVGSRLQAVQNGMVLPGGNAEQGPIVHLFQLEMAAQQLFPERFGTWRWGEAPDEPLFNRAELADIILGKNAEKKKKK